VYVETIQIKPLCDLQEMYPVVELQKVYWGQDSEALVPAHMLFTIAVYGGHVLAALDGERMVGVLIGLLGMQPDDSMRSGARRILIASKRMVVLPEYRGRGIGYQLKLAQRQIALEQGVPLVAWTFDPLTAANAHLNLHKLGCVSRKYLENYYGTEESGHTGLVTLGASDRLMVEWWVAHPRIEEHLNGMRRALGLKEHLEAGAVIVNPTHTVGDRPHVPDDFRNPKGAAALLEIPVAYDVIIEDDPMLAAAWREHTRSAFGHLLAESYTVTDFLRQEHEGRDRAFYVMSYNTGLESD
jgi:chorismate synthase